MSDPMAELTQRFKGEALDRTGQIELLLNALPSAADPAAICDEIRDHAHKLKGAAGIFGFDDFKQRAAEVEEEAGAQAGAADGMIAAGALAPVVGELLAVIPTE
ncbi:MAG: Hpt domain-containing protein [Thermoleophilaceae bacterium]|nr:Hpt domain-containing protein [Thermoleophilaceae bacterium]